MFFKIIPICEYCSICENTYDEISIAVIDGEDEYDICLFCVTKTKLYSKLLKDVNAFFEITDNEEIKEHRRLAQENRDIIENISPKLYKKILKYKIPEEYLLVLE